jgi:CRP-like cAMP-binding protein
MQLLSDDERVRLSLVASIVRFDKGNQIYHEADYAAAVFDIISGVVKTYRTTPDKAEHIGAFLFADDLFGLTEERRYVNSAKAVTAVTAYRIPIAALEARLPKDAALEFHVICKLCHELRETQRHALLLGRRNALVRMAMFIQMLEEFQSAKSDRTRELNLPMSRSDIADYVGMSPETVSRSFRALESRRILEFSGRRRLRIVDRHQLEALAAHDEDHMDSRLADH